MISMLSAISAINPALGNMISIKQNPNKRDFYGKHSLTKVELRYNEIITRLIELKGEPLGCNDIAEMFNISLTTVQKNMAVIESDGFCSSRRVRKKINGRIMLCIEFFIRQ